MYRTDLFHIVNWYVPCGLQVAEMEIQMKSLEQTAAEADAKRLEAEEKLIASTARDLGNQVDYWAYACGMKCEHNRARRINFLSVHAQLNLKISNHMYLEHI